MNGETAEMTVVSKTVVIFQCNGNQSPKIRAESSPEIPCILNVPQVNGYVQKNCVRSVFILWRNILHGRNKENRDIRKNEDSEKLIHVES
jgi:hypothetical protein